MSRVSDKMDYQVELLRQLRDAENRRAREQLMAEAKYQQTQQNAAGIANNMIWHGNNNGTAVMPAGGQVGSTGPMPMVPHVFGNAQRPTIPSPRARGERALAGFVDGELIYTIKSILELLNAHVEAADYPFTQQRCNDQLICWQIVSREWFVACGWIGPITDGGGKDEWMIQLGRLADKIKYEREHDGKRRAGYPDADFPNVLDANRLQAIARLLSQPQQNFARSVLGAGQAQAVFNATQSGP